MELCSLLTESQCAAVCIPRASAELRCTTDQCHHHLGGIEETGLAVMELGSLLTESQCAAVCILRASAELRCTTDQGDGSALDEGGIQVEQCY